VADELLFFPAAPVAGERRDGAGGAGRQPVRRGAFSASVRGEGP
jgi:hypothetical protein